MGMSSDALMAVWVLCAPVIAPAVLMVAAHWFPWRATPLRRLSENQARVYGVTCILASVMVAVALGEALGVTLGAWQVIGLAWVAAISAGAATIWAWAIDARLKLQQDITEEKHRTELLRSYAEERDIH